MSKALFPSTVRTTLMAMVFVAKLTIFGFSPELHAGEVSPPPQVPIQKENLPGEAEQWWDTFAQGVEWHDKAVLGDEEATDKAISRFEEILSAHPEATWVWAYLGSAFTLKARDAPLLRKRGWVNQGFETLDKAVEKSPNDPVVRLIRAINSYHVPRMLDRRGVAEEDFAHLMAKLQNEDHGISYDLRRAIYFHAGAFALQKRESESLNLLEKALATEGSPHLDEPIRQSLAIARRRFDDS